jgi:hypothetical protein
MSNLFSLKKGLSNHVLLDQHLHLALDKTLREGLSVYHEIRCIPFQRLRPEDSPHI